MAAVGDSATLHQRIMEHCQRTVHQTASNDDDDDETQISPYHRASLAAAVGQVYAMNWLHLCYLTGTRGAPKDETKAFDYIYYAVLTVERRIAVAHVLSHDCLNALFHYGMCMKEGIGTRDGKPDYEEAVKWWTLAIRHGSAYHATIGVNDCFTELGLTPHRLPPHTPHTHTPLHAFIPPNTHTHTHIHTHYVYILRRFV